MSTTLPGRIENSGRSLDEAARLSERFYGRARFEATPDDRPFAFRFASLGDADVTLRVSSITGSLRGDIERLDDYVVTWFREGSGTITARGVAADVAAGQPIVLPSAIPFTIEARPGRQNLVHVARTFLESLATERHGGPVQPIAFQHDVVPTVEHVAEWRRVMAMATPVITDVDAPLLLRVESNLAVARALLAVFAWHTQLLPPALLVPRLAKIRAAVEFFHDNAHLPISPSDAAAAAGLHPRSLQGAFQRHLQTSPTEYLRMVRLDRVRRDLLEHSPKTATVNDLARGWGFGNLGRFAKSYQERFGEKPSDTLRRP